MLKNIKTFFGRYKQFAFVMVTVVVAFILELFHQPTIAHWILAASAILNVIPLLWGMVEDLRSGKWGIDILAATAIITSVILKEYWAGIVIVVMLTGGEALEDYAENRAQVELSALMEHVPKKAHLLRGRKQIDVPLTHIKVGDKIIIKPGEVVPVDAEIVEGESSFDESSLTGESLPLEKATGDELLSGSVNLESAITARAVRIASESQYEQIIELVRSAASTEAPFVRLTDRYAVPFTLISFAIAGAAWAISGQPIRFLEVIVVATPCPLLLAAPIALISGMSRAAKHGIIIKNGTALEKLAEVRTVGFDKTGTLTKGIPEIDEIVAMKSFTKNDVIKYAAAAEQQSNHILAQTIIRAATDQKITIPKAKRVAESAGHGLKAHVGSNAILVGKLRYLQDAGVTVPATLQAKNIKSTTTFVAVNNTLAGYLSFTDEIRPEASTMLQRIRKLGVKNTLMVTGDNKPTALKIAKTLGITEVYADALPGDKVRAVEQAHYQPVAFVGDGVNDAPVLAASSVGIALGARGSTAASESADVIIMLDDIKQVSNALKIARQTFAIAKQTIFIGIGLSIILQLIFFTGRFQPIYGAVLQEVVDVVVIFNALRAHGSFRKKVLS